MHVDMQSHQRAHALKVFDLLFDVIQPAAGEFTGAPGIGAAVTIGCCHQIQQFPAIVEGKPQMPGLAQKHKTTNIGFDKHAITGRAAPDRIQQTDLLVVSDSGGGNAGHFCSFAYTHD